MRQQEATLRDKCAVLKEYDDAILELLKDEEIEAEIEQAGSYSEKIQLALCEIKTALEQVVPTSMTGAGGLEAGTSHPPAAPAVPTAAGVTTPSLLKITLRKFSGDHLQWFTFWDSFKSAVHDSSELTDIYKFNYLHSLLEHSAAEAVAGLALTAANYTEAINILQKWFGDRQLIIGKHMETLLNLEPVTTYNERHLGQMYDKVESHVRAFKALGILLESYGSLLTSTLLNKVPADIRLIVSQHVGGGDWTLDALMKELVKEIEARERATAAQVCMPSSTGHNPGSLQTARAMFSIDTCPYCEQSHTATSCPRVTDVNTHRQILRKAGRCFNCTI